MTLDQDPQLDTIRKQYSTLEEKLRKQFNYNLIIDILKEEGIF